MNGLISIPNPHVPDVRTFAEGKVQYTIEPGVALLGATQTFPQNFAPFIQTYAGMGGDYAEESVDALQRQLISPGGLLAKFAGQLCYLSLGEKKRTRHADAKRYFDNIKSEKHGSILEHVSFTFLLWGIDRAVTHELVRHRLASYSQVSQRFVGLDRIRFCMPYDIQGDGELVEGALLDMHADYLRFGRWIEAYKKKYPARDGEESTEWRKRLQSASRRVLPNWVEAPIVMTANVRSWRHVLTKRGAKSADVAIRRPIVHVAKQLKVICPELFDDVGFVELPDGSTGVTVAHEAV